MILHQLSGNLGHFIEPMFATPGRSQVGGLAFSEDDCSPNASQFYSVFLGLRFSCENNFILELHNRRQAKASNGFPGV